MPQRRQHDSAAGAGVPRRRAAREVDTRGSHCPGPLFEAIRLVRECLVGETVAVVTADAAGGAGISAWAHRARQPLAIEEFDGGRRYLITRVR
ncbi:MAG: sulfurtransferase TusA family protein [Actinobacteria bacterium]|jgi:TusA-related sulfurtransferase|nr:sulfurtransferase TusA family protein [Actinomycetota bacterium]